MVALQLIVSIIGNGTVTSADPVINCPGSCGPFTVGNGFGGSTTLTAIPDSGWVFSGWEVTGIPIGMTPTTSAVSVQEFIVTNPDASNNIEAAFVRCPDLSLVDSGPFNVEAGVVITPIQLVGTGGTGPYTFVEEGLCGSACCDGFTDMGLSMDINGLITGTPTVFGCIAEITRYCTAQVRVTDTSTGCSSLVCITVQQPLCPTITLENSGPFSIFLNEPITPIQLVAQGGTAPYTYVVDPNWDACPGGLCFGATLPSGLTIEASTGIISGTATAGSPCTYVPILITDVNQCQSRVCIQIISSVKPLPPCYDLIACGDRPNPITVTNNLGQYVGQVIQILGECFTVAIAQSCTGAITLNNPIITAFADCCSCNPPKVYELVDCTLQTPAIITATPLGSYVGQTVKVCEFISSPIVQIDGIPVNCGANELGFVTNITGPTSGSYYDGISNSIKPYTNPLNFPLSVGDQLCVNPISPFDVIVHTGGTYLVQFFIGTTSITNQITVNSAMPIPTLQWFIDNQITATNTTIVVNTFDTFNHLNVTITTTQPLTETNVTIIVTFPGIVYPPTTTVTDVMLGQCICYTVNDLGTSCTIYPPFTGVISGAFPDCVCCNPPPEPEPAPYIPTIPEIDKHTYRIPESQCDIDANKTFANAMYDQFRVDAYGMEDCCPKNMNSIWIQKELSDLNKLNC